MFKEELGFFFIPITKTFIKYGNIEVPSLYDQFLKGRGKVYLFMGDVSFHQKVVSKGYKTMFEEKGVLKEPSAFQVRMSQPCRRFLMEAFSYTYAISAPDKKLSFQESLKVTVYKAKGHIVFVLEPEKVYDGEAADFIKRNIKRADFFQKALSRGSERAKGEYIISKSILRPFVSQLYPIDEIVNHNMVGNCVYMWFAEKEQKMYIGKANFLHRRILEHRSFAGRVKKGIESGIPYEITHFAYLEFHPLFPEVLLEVIEKILIKAFALFIPNNSYGPSKIIPINNSGWEMMNDSYE